jgi:hypothetical protein
MYVHLRIAKLHHSLRKNIGCVMYVHLRIAKLHHSLRKNREISQTDPNNTTHHRMPSITLDEKIPHRKSRFTPSPRPTSHQKPNLQKQNNQRHQGHHDTTHLTHEARHFEDSMAEAT